MIAADVVERVLHEALRRGGDLAEVFAEDRRSTAATLDDGRVEEVASSEERGAGIRVLCGETTGFAYTADLSERGLVEAARTASAVARGRGASVQVAPPGGSRPTPGAVRLPPEEVPTADKVALLRQADDAARASNASVAQVSASYGDARRRILVARSDGVFAEDDQVRTRLSVTCVAAGDSGMQTGFESVARTAGFEVFDERAAGDVAGQAARRAVAKLAARPAPSGMLPVILAAGSGGILFHEACGHGLEADHIVKDASVYAHKLGEPVASPLVTLVDDGTMPGEWGASAIDDEGWPAQRNVLIERGVLTDYMWDLVRARREGRAPGGNGRRQSYRDLPMVRMTNTFITAGEGEPDDIIASTPYGVYVAKLGGGQVNTATGDFVFGTVEAYLVENGRVTEPLRDANLVGNGPEILRRVDAVAGDFATSPGTCGKDGQNVPVGCGQPTLRISGVTVGGTAGGEGAP